MSSLLQDNRSLALVPENPFEVSIGTRDRSLRTIHTSNIEVFGEVNTKRLVINGYVFNLDDLFLSSVEKNVNFDEIKSTFIETSNLTVTEDINGGNFIGNGDQLVFSALRNSIIPGSASLTLGTEESEFKTIFTDELLARNVFVHDTVTAKFYEGDASRLSNLDLKFDSLPESIIPDSNLSYTIGSHGKRFINVFTKDLNAIQNMRGKRMIITNETYDEHLDDLVEGGNDFLSKYDINDDVMQRLGDKIDIQIDTMISGVGYIVDSICKNITVQDRIVPQFTGQGQIGTEDLIFNDLHTQKLHVYDMLSLKDIDADSITSRKMNSEEISGNGEFIDGITHFGSLTSNVLPKFDVDINLGASNLRFKEVQAKDIYADDIFLKGKGRVILPIIGKLDLKIGHTYVTEGRIQFQAETISSFAHDIDFEQGSFAVDKSGLYHITLFGVKSEEKTSSQDTNMSWQINHFNRATQTSTIIPIQRQSTHTLFLTELDIISLKIFSTPVSEMTITQGIVLVQRSSSIADLDSNFPSLRSGGS